jgi:hypothetical protein
MKSTREILRVLSSLIVVFCFLTPIAAAQSIPDEIQTALEEYASLDPISIHWEGVRTSYAWGPTEELSTTSSYSRQDHGFFWMEETRQTSGRVPKGAGGPAFRRTYRFDGNVVSATDGERVASWYLIAQLNKAQPKTSRFHVPYFEAAGIYCPTQQEKLPEGVLQSNILYLIRNSAELVSCEQAQLQQEALVRIEIVAENPAWEEFLGNYENMMKYEKDRLKNKNISREEFDEIVKTKEKRKKTMPEKLRWVYYLSPENGYAVRKHERLTMDGKVTASYSNGSFESVPGTDITLAGRVKMSSFEKVGSHSYELLSTPAHTVELSVVKVSTETVPKERFVLDMEEVVPGATVIDAVTPELQRKDGSVITFPMPASPDDLDAAVAAATGKYGRAGQSRLRRNLIRYGLIVPGLALILIAAVRIYLARRRVG